MYGNESEAKRQDQKFEGKIVDLVKVNYSEEI